MALESATYISELVDTNPVISDPVGQGDDHLRMLKTVLKTQFSGLAGTTAITADESEMNLLDGGYEGTAVVSTGESGGTKFLREDGDATCSWVVPTDTNTTYTAGDGLDLTGTTFSTDLLANGGLEIQSTELSVSQGISQYDVPQFASGVVDDDFLRISTTSVEGRSASEVLSDIGGQAYDADTAKLDVDQALSEAKSTVNSVVSIARPPPDLRSVLNAVPVRSRPSPAV